MRRRIDMPPSERVELVLRLLRKEAKAAELAREAEISEQTVFKWRDEFLKGGTERLTNGRGDLERERRRHAKELAERDQVIGEITLANRILKKKNQGLFD